MTNPFANSFSPAGATSVFNTTFTMDSDLTYIDVVATLNGVKVTNFTKTSTTQLTFVAPLPSGTLKVERNTSGARKYVFTPGTRVVAEQVAGELDRLVASSLEDAQRSYTSYSTMSSNAGAYVAIDPTGEHEVLTSVAPVAVYTTWGSPGAIGNVSANTGNFTTLTGAIGTVTPDAGVFTSLLMTGTQTQKDAFLASTGVASSGYQAFKNYFENGDFQIFSRQLTGFSKANPANGTYYLDRWYNYQTGTAATWTVSRQEFTLGQTAVPGNPRYFARTVVTTAAGTTMGHARRVEDVRRLAGKTMTLSFNAKADAARTITLSDFQNFGTGGAPSGNVTGTLTGTAALTTTLTRFAFTFTVPSISGKTMGTNENTSYHHINFALPLSNGATYEFSDMQLEESTSATKYERLENTQEQVRCQRYGKAVPVATGQYGVTANGNTTMLPVGVPFRTIPTHRLTAGDNTDIVAGAFTNVSTFSPSLGSTWLVSTAWPAECPELVYQLVCTATGLMFVSGLVAYADAELY